MVPFALLRKEPRGMVASAGGGGVLGCNGERGEQPSKCVNSNRGSPYLAH